MAIMLVGVSIFAQETISGTVSDADGPLPGANVTVTGTTQGVVTDFDGKYTIEGVKPNATLHFSFVGYLSQDVAVDGRSLIDVILEDDANQLNEVVVTGYVTQTRGEISGSVVSVDMEEAQKVPVTNAAEALQGRVSGVTVIASSEPGASPTINIRGLGSTNSTGPLYIIDGVQTTDAGIFNNINPSDIEQMNVLKDGSASIYGARAANGVVVVTTKSGGYNMAKSELTFDIYGGISVVANTPDLLNTQQLSQIRFDGNINDGNLDPTHPQYRPNSSYTWGVPDKIIDPSTALPMTSPSVSVKSPNGTDWFDEITRTAPTTSFTLSLLSGNETSKSFFSAGYITRDAVVIHNSYKRFNVQLNNEFKPWKKLKIGEHLNVNYSKTSGANNIIGELAVRSNPLTPVYDDNGDFAGNYSNSHGLAVAQNPVAVAYRDRNDYGKSLGVFGDVYLEYEIIDGLTFKSTFAGSIGSWDNRDFTALNPEYAERLTVNSLAESDGNYYSWTFTNMVSYRNSFGDHNVNAFIAIEALENWSKGKGVSRTDYFNESPDFYLLSNGFGDPNIDWAGESQNSIFSVFGSLDYNYKHRYFFTATVRSDTSSRFAGDNKTGVFPAFSAGWIISKEDFYSQQSVLSLLKLKASWGKLGNQELPVNNPTLSLFSFNQNTANYAFNQGQITSGAVLNQVGNPDLRWEISETSNIGLDFGFLSNKLYASLEFWNISTNGLIVRDNKLISTTAPDATPPYVNIGDIRNTGVDFSVGWNDTTESGFTYGIDFNLSHYKNEVISLIDGTPVPGSSITSWVGRYTRTEEGEPMSYFYGMNIKGFDDEGRWVYEDVNGDGTVDDSDRTKIGSPHPDFTYGLNFHMGIKGFDLSAFFNGSQGNDVYNHNKIFTDFPLFVDNNRNPRVLNSWTPTNTNAELPALSGSLHGVEINSNSYFVEDGSYFRFKNLQIGYSLSDKLTSKLKMDRFRVYIQGTNLATITGYEGLDPEVLPIDNLNMGIDIRTFPLSKIYSLGVNLKF